MTNKKPQANKIETILETHGDRRFDPYFWLNERDSDDVLAYLKEENTYLENELSNSKELRDNLFEEMKARVPKVDSSAPFKKDSYYHYSRTEEKSDYSIFCRKKESLKNPEEIILDSNELAKGKDFFDLGSLSISKDDKLCAYTEDNVGRRIFTLSIKDLTTGIISKDLVSGTSGNFIWGNDNKTLYYTKRDPETLRSFELWSFHIETKETKRLFEEKETAYSIQVSKSKTSKYLFLNSGSTLTTETHYLELDIPESELKIFSPKKEGVEYSVEDGGDQFFVLTNLRNKDFSLMSCSKKSSSHENWQEYLPVEEKVFLDDFDVFKDFIALRESHEGLLKVRLLNRKDKSSHYIETNDSSYEIDFYQNPEYDSSSFSYTYESLTTPYSVVSYNTRTKESTVIKEKQVLGNFDAKNYISTRLFAKSRDGKDIPISLVHRKDVKLDKSTPLLQYAYGSYGLTVYPYFSAERLSLLDRGFAYALCHIRGGSYKGRSWYEDGKMFSKKNTFNDFIDCSQHLINEGYTSSDHLYAQGGSAGGLLMGAIINMNPELYKGVISQVPFVDVVTTMLDDTIPLTTFEYDEWGNPNKEKDYWYIKSYSPYDNIEKKAYPNLLVTTGYHDSQVQYWEPAKWVAKLRDFKQDDNLLLFHTDFTSGHGGASGRFEHLKDIALNYTFMLSLEKRNS